MKKISVIMILLLSVFINENLFAKDNISIKLEIGAEGGEKNYTRTSYVDSYEIDVPYSSNVFNPIFLFGFELPFLDLSSTTFLSIIFNYDYQYYLNASASTYTYYNTEQFYHGFSLVPEITYGPKKLKITFGTGLKFSLISTIYENEYMVTNSNSNYKYKYKEEWADFQLLFLSQLGLKYFVSKHIAIIGDFSVMLPLTKFSDGGKNSVYIDDQPYLYSEFAPYTRYGLFSFIFSPKIGVSWTF